MIDAHQLAARLARAGVLLAEASDVLRGRVTGPAPPAWARARGLPPADAAELDAVATRAHAEFGSLRRLSLPRLALGRLLEVAVVLDRACALAEAGHAVTVEAVFPQHVSPRNLAILAHAARD